MKPVEKFLLACGAALVLHPAAAGEAQQSFSFDDGAGLTGTASHYRFSSRHGDFYPYEGTPVSRYLLHRSYGPGALHYGTTLAGDESHYYGGVSLGPATLAYFQGRGNRFRRHPIPCTAT